MNRTRFTELLAVHAEALATLGGAVALTLALTLALTTAVILLAPPQGIRAEVPLQATDAGLVPTVPHDELVDRLREHGIAQGVDVVQRGGSDRLVLRGVSSRETAELAVLKALAEGGYQLGSVEFVHALDPMELIKDPWVLIPGLAIQATVFLVIGGVMTRWRVRARPALVGAARAGGYGLLGGVTAVAASIGLGFLLEQLGFPVEEQPLLQELLKDPGNLLRLAPWIILAAPIAEEVFFRGYLFRFLAQGAGLPTGYLVSSALFALVHLNLSGFLVYVVVGCLFAMVYSRTSNLLAPITAHVTYNGSLMLALALIP